MARCSEAGLAPGEGVGVVSAEVLQDPETRVARLTEPVHGLTGEVLVTTWPDGGVSVAYRERPMDRWGPPARAERTR